MTAKRTVKKSDAKKKSKGRSAAPSRAAVKAGIKGKTKTKKAAGKVGSKKASERGSAKKPASKVTKKTAKGKPAARKKAVKRVKKKAAAKAKAAKRRPPLDLGKFGNELRAKQAELLQAYINAKGDSRARESDGTEDYIDYAVSSYDREFLLSLTELEQSQLNLVEEALARIGAGRFGLCVQCEKPIPAKRLEVQPWARYCLRCQELADQGLADEEDYFTAEDEDTETVDDEIDVEEVDEVEDSEEASGGRLLSR